MKQTKALRSMLADMVEVYHRKLAEDGETPEVCFTTGTPHANSHARDCDCDVTGSHVAVSTNIRDTYGKSVDGANELRILVDTLCHEDAHHAYSVLSQKKEFSEQYPECPQFAGLVQNVLEDQYIDWQRLKQFRGLRGPHSFKVDAIMANGSRRPPLYNLEQSEQVAEGFLQMAFAGYVKGYTEAEDEVQRAIAKCRPLVDTVRNTHDAEAREEIAHACMDILLEAVPDPQEADEYTDENGEGMPTDEPQDLTEQEKQDLLDDLDPEDLADSPEDAGQTVEIDPEKHDVPEWLEDEMEPAEGGSSQQEQDEQEQEDEAAEGGDEQADPQGEGEDEAEDEQGGGGEGDEQEDSEDQPGEQGEGEAPEQEQEQDSSEQGGDEGGDTSSEGEQQDSQEGGDDTEGSTGQQGDQGEDSDAGQPEGGPDRPDQEVGEGPDVEDGSAGGADPVQNLVDDLAKKERERNAGDHWNAGDTDYSAPDEDFQRRYETIQQEVRQEQTELGQQKRRREQRMQDQQERSGYERRKDGADRIRELLRGDGTAEDIVEAFKKFKTQDRWLPDTRGERLNVRNATRRLAGDYSEDRVYDRKLKAEVGDRCVGVALDLSNSMNGVNALRQPKMALGALHLATKTIGDDLLAAGYKTLKNHPQKGKYEPVLDLITGPQEGFDWDHLDAAKAGMYTPTADGVMYTLDLLKKSHRREKVMVVITDGKANIELGGGKSSSGGKAHAKRAVNTARQEGVKVLGMAVGRVGDEYMDEVFGPGAWFHTDSDTLTQDLVALYEDQMRTKGQQRRA